MKRLPPIVGTLVVFFVCGLSVVVSGGPLEDYQHDMDIVRLKDIKALGALIEEYRSQSGHYPLVGAAEVPNYIFIATKEQKQFIRGKPPYEHVVTDVKEFIKEMEKGLGRKIEIPFDPQRRPVNKPNCYIYMVQGETYTLAVHLHNNYPFARKIKEFYYKLEVSNVPNPNMKIWAYEALVKNKKFQEAIAEPLLKPGYAEELRKKLREQGAF